MSVTSDRARDTALTDTIPTGWLNFDHLGPKISQHGGGTGTSWRLPHRQQSDLPAPSLPFSARLTTTPALRQHRFRAAPALFSGSRHTDSKLNRCTAHVTVFYVALLASGIDHQLIAFSAVRAVDDLSIVLNASPGLTRSALPPCFLAREKYRQWYGAFAGASRPTYLWYTQCIEFPLSPPALRRWYRDRLRNVGRGRFLGLC